MKQLQVRGPSKATVRLRQRGSWPRSPSDSAVYPSAVCSFTGTYGVVYFYNVIIPPAATTPLKPSSCWGKNSVKRPTHPDTAQHKQWSWGPGNTDNSTAPPRANSSEATSMLRRQNGRSRRIADWTRTSPSCPPVGPNRNPKWLRQHIREKETSF